MALYRKHHGSLDESLKTTVIVKNAKELVNRILDDWEGLGEILKDFVIKVEPYCGFDTRIGWYTHIVTAALFEKDVFFPVGFLSEPLEQ